MLTIHKYEVPLEEVVSLSLPEGAKFLHFDNQFDRPCLWCLVDTDKSKVLHKFRLLKTGYNLAPYLAEELQYIGTALFIDDSLVFHLFHIKP